jgi:hypothetical protein
VYDVGGTVECDDLRVLSDSVATAEEVKRPADSSCSGVVNGEW